MREENIFYRLKKDDEDASTELLCNICKFDINREIILRELKINNSNISYFNIDSQYKIPGKTKRPDIIIENNEIKVLIENKVSKYRKLELSQITVYPQHLNEIIGKKVKLIFLIPHGYKDEYKIRETKKEFKFISIVYWDDLIYKLKINNKTINSEILSESIVFFEKILNSIQEINFEQEEIDFMNDLNLLFKESTAIGKTLQKFDNIIWQLKDNLKLSFRKGGNPRIEVSEDGIGYWFYMECFYIGYSFTIMNIKKMKDYILSFTIHESIVSKEKLKKLQKNTYEFYDEWYWFKINFEYLENEKELLKFCEKSIKNLVKGIG
jgi:hypothetical protein